MGRPIHGPASLLSSSSLSFWGFALAPVFLVFFGVVAFGLLRAGSCLCSFGRLGACLRLCLCSLGSPLAFGLLVFVLGRACGRVCVLFCFSFVFAPAFVLVVWSWASGRLLVLLRSRRLVSFLAFFVGCPACVFLGVSVRVFVCALLALGSSRVAVSARSVVR